MQILTFAKNHRKVYKGPTYERSLNTDCMFVYTQKLLKIHRMFFWNAIFIKMNT